MKPTTNYGLSDSLIDAVRKSVEEALVGGQKKLDVDKDGKLEKSDFASLRAKKDAVNTKPKLKEEDELDEAHRRGGNRFLNTREKDAIQKKMKPLDPKAPVEYKDKHSITRGLPHEEQLIRHIHAATGHHVYISPFTHTMHPHDSKEVIAKEVYNTGGKGTYGGPGGTKHTPNSLVQAVKKFHNKKLRAEEVEQMDEAPLRTFNALVGYPAADKKVAAKGTPGSEDERNKAAAGLKRDRSGLGRAAYTGTQHYDVRREEEQMDEISSELAGRASNARIDRNNSGGVSHTDLKKLRKGTTPLDQQRKTTAGYMKTLDRKNEEVEQMEEARYDNEADAQSIVDILKEEHKDGNYSVRPVGSGYAVVHPYLSNSNVNRNIKKLEEEEQMDEDRSDRMSAEQKYQKHMSNHYRSANNGNWEAAENHAVRAEKAATRHFKTTGKKIYDPGYTGNHPHITSGQNEEYEQMDEANSDNPEFEGRLAAIDMHHYKEADHHRKTLRTLGIQGKLNTPEGKFHKAALEKHQSTLNAMAASDHEIMRKKLKQSMRSNLKREEVEQMDEVKLADLPRRKVMGKSYGADYVDPEGADETAADMKKAEPKRKSGPQGTMKRRFIKDKSKLRMQYK